MKPFDGGQWVGVSRVGSPDELRARYDESGERMMHLQTALEGFDVFVRSLSIGAETMVDVVRPVAADVRPLPGEARLPDAGARRRDPHDQPARQRVLPLGVQLVRDDRQGRRCVPDRLRECVARRRAHVAALLLPVGDHRARALVGVLRRHAPRDAHQPELARVLRLGRPRGPLVRGEAREVPRARRRCTSSSTHTRSSATRISRISTSSRTSGSRRASSTRVLVDTVRSTFPTHEHEHFVAHYRGLLGAWARDNAPQTSVSPGSRDA